MYIDYTWAGWLNLTQSGGGSASFPGCSHLQSGNEAKSG